MKAKYVPFTSVSVDTVIQELRDMFDSDENLEIEPDGTISRAGSTHESNSDIKAKTVPKAIVSASEDGRSVQEIIKEMRGDADESANDAEVSPSENISSGKTSIVPKGIVSDTSVSDLINEIRGMDNSDTNDEEIEEVVNDIPSETKPKIVPKGIVSFE